MPSPELAVEDRSNEQLLTSLIRSTDKAERIAADYSLEQLADIHQAEAKLTPKEHIRLRAAIELGRRVHEAKTAYRNVTKIKCTSDAIDFCRQQFSRLISDAMQEQFHITTLTTKNQVINMHHITTGTLDASLVHPREVFRPALRDSASSILLIHNHPSGDPTPSREDFAVTSRLKDAGKLLGIDVLDHIVVARDGVVSLAES